MVAGGYPETLLYEAGLDNEVLDLMRSYAELVRLEEDSMRSSELAEAIVRDSQPRTRG